METCKLIRRAHAHRVVLFAALYLLTPAGSSAQRHGRPSSLPVRHTAAILTVDGRIAKPLYLTLADFHAFPRSTVRIAQGSRDTTLYEGVPLIEILRKAGAPIGGQNKEELRMCVEAVSRNGSHVIFSLAELDPAFADSNVLVADTVNGAASPEAGLLLVAGTDKVTLRSIQHLITIRLRRLR